MSAEDARVAELDKHMLPDQRLAVAKDYPARQLFL